MKSIVQCFSVWVLCAGALGVGAVLATPVRAQSINHASCVADVLGEHPGSQVNIRAGAGMHFDVIGTVSVGNLVIVANDDNARGAAVTPLSRSDEAGNWWFLTARYRASEYRGWMRADYLRLRCP